MTSSISNSGELPILLFYLPCFIFILTGLLGLRVNQNRFFFSAILFLLALITSSTRANLLARSGFMPVSDITLIALCFGLTFLFWTPTARPNRKKGLWGWASIVLSASLFLFFFRLSPAAMGKIWKIPFFLHSTKLHFPPLAFYFLSLLCVRFGFEYDRLVRQLHLFLAISLAPIFSYVLYGHDSFAHSVSFLVSSALLFIGLLRMFFQKIYLDELSGISNRRALDEKLNSLSGVYSIAMIDIDHFKKFNDNYGHEEGDNVLRFVAQHFKRMTDNRTYRYGGEEFCTVIEDVGESAAVKIMDEAREALSKIKFTLRAGQRQDPFSVKGILGRLGIVARAGAGQAKTVSVTVSIGVGHSTPKKSAHDIQSASDGALYKAKEGGRNRVCQA